MGRHHIFKGIKKLIILNIIKDGPVHGSEIHRILTEKYGLEIPKAIVYMILRKMEELGLIESEWETCESGPVKRLYKISEKGLDFLIDSKDALEKLRNTIDELIENILRLSSEMEGVRYG